MMPTPPERYRKLPGARRGLVRRSSVWAGSDHLLLANSVRFREDYKRFYFRDIQAIAVADAPRAEISTRAVAIGFAWLAAYLALRSRLPHGDAVFWLAFAALTGAWLSIATLGSCRCRLYTAVSRDELPSVNRRWIARRFLAEVEPLIEKAQGRLEGDWAAAAEAAQAGPEPVRPAPGASAAAGAAAAPSTPARPAAPVRTLASDLFVASLFAAALLDVFTMRSAARAAELAGYGAAFLEATAAVGVLIEYHRGQLRAAMQRLAVIALVLIGISFYLRQVVVTVASSGTQVLPDVSLLVEQPAYILMREIAAAVWLLLALTGAAIPLVMRETNR